MYQNLPEDRHPDFFKSKLFTKQKDKKGKDRFDNYAAAVFKKSMLVDKSRVQKFLKKPTEKALEKDPGLAIVLSLIDLYRNIAGEDAQRDAEHQRLMKIYIEGLREMQPNKLFYPDANFSMRLSIGQIEPYSVDGKDYKYYTIGKEILEKEVPGDDEFSVPAELHKLLVKKDYGRYARKDGQLPVCFLSTNDITGGNSGSPVIDANGNLIGLAFDGNWESMVSDLIYEPDINRTISVDIRYVLFIIDKFAHDQRLIDELKLVGG